MKTRELSASMGPRSRDGLDAHVAVRVLVEADDRPILELLEPALLVPRPRRLTLDGRLAFLTLTEGGDPEHGVEGASQALVVEPEPRELGRQSRLARRALLDDGKVLVEHRLG